MNREGKISNNITIIILYYYSTSSEISSWGWSSETTVQVAQDFGVEAIKFTPDDTGKLVELRKNSASVTTTSLEIFAGLNS